jgi:hypothetical protein
VRSPLLLLAPLAVFGLLLATRRGRAASGGSIGLPIEDYARADMQATCDPEERPGLQAFRAWVLRTYGGRDGGISRACEIGKASEHKEGRAWDWMVDPATARSFANFLLASDDGGNAHAMFRRAGIMYMIHDRHWWRGYAERAWIPYDGGNPHTDHVHFSFGWPGAMGRTSFYSMIAGERGIA